MPISFDTTGFQQTQAAQWVNSDTGDMVALQYFDLPPDLPAPLEQLDVLRARLAEIHARSGSLVEAFVIGVDSQPALLRVEKMPLPDRPAGLLFAASIVAPKENCSAALMLFCPEGGVTGIREATVMAMHGHEDMFPPHPYQHGVQGQLPYNRADDIHYDAQFPDHPLTRARRWVARTVPTMRLAPDFAGLPPFRGSC
ncbi:hypothetical protein [Nocardia sp. IFM 10818]